MKRNIAILTLLVFAGFAYGATPRTFSLINGSNVLLATNHTTYFDDTNVLYHGPNGAYWLSWTNDPGNTNAFHAAWSKDMTVAADANGNVNSNIGLMVQFGNTNLLSILMTNTAGQYYVSNANDTLANVPSATTWYPIFVAGTITNTYTFTFLRSIDGTTFPNPHLSGANAPGGQDTFVFTIPFAGLCTNMVFSTNFPSAFVTGARAIRLGSVGSAATATTVNQGALLNNVKITQWVP